MSEGSLLHVADLEIAFPAKAGSVEVVRDVSFDIHRGEILGLVGESGSGKSMSALAVMRLVPEPGKVTRGEIELAGKDLRALSPEEMRKVRGARIGMIFQEPMTALNPVFTIGQQIEEAVRVHRPVSRREAHDEAVRLLGLVAIPEPEERLRSYPHQLSGGQRQRAMIAMALACGPELLIADEPTTALDVTIQAQILELIDELRQELDLAVLLITHDLAVVAETCDRVCVMYSGELVETASVETLFDAPAHPYTQGLLAALPRLGQPAPRGELPSIPGQVPEPWQRPPGCAFQTRCAHTFEACRASHPELVQLSQQQWSRCFLHDVEGEA